MVHSSISLLPPYFIKEKKDPISRQGINHCANFLKLSERACLCVLKRIILEKVCHKNFMQFKKNTHLHEGCLEIAYGIPKRLISDLVLRTAYINIEWKFLGSFNVGY